MDLPARASRAATRVGTYVFMVQREYRADGERSCLSGGRARRTEPRAADHVRRRRRGAPSGYRGNYTSRHCQRTRHTRPTDHRAPVTNHLLPSSGSPPGSDDSRSSNGSDFLSVSKVRESKFPVEGFERLGKVPGGGGI